MNHSTQICQKIACAFFVALSLTFGACNQPIDLRVPSPEETPGSLKSASTATEGYICNPQSAPFIAGQTNTAGTVNLSVNTNNGNIIVSVSTQDGWAFKSIQLFIGSQAQLPVNNGGNPQIGNFLVNLRFSNHRTTFGYELIKDANSILLDDISRPYIIIAVHADVDKLDTNGRILQSESAWMDGTRIIKKENWAAYYVYYLMPCGITQP